MLAAYLIVKHGMSSEQAMQTVRQTRPGSVENRGQENFLAELAERYKNNQPNCNDNNTSSVIISSDSVNNNNNNDSNNNTDNSNSTLLIATLKKQHEFNKQ